MSSNSPLNWHRRFLANVLPVLCLALAGCGGERTPVPADPAAAGKAVQALLDTWKGGGKPEDLARGAPRILGYDCDWARGATLVGYEIQPNPQSLGDTTNIHVQLERLVDKKKIKSRVMFVVTAGDPILVAREN